MIHLFDLPHAEARRLAQSGSPIFLLVNPVEYHGPHLSLHNDRLISLGLMRALHTKLVETHPEWSLVLADDLEMGVDPCPGPGSRHTPFADVRAQVMTACRALADLGAQRVVLMTFHGSPLHGVALHAGTKLLQDRGVRALSPFNLLMHFMMDFNAEDWVERFGSHADTPEREAALRGLQTDFHAGYFETSLALHFAPDSVDPAHVNLPPCPPLPMRGPIELARRGAQLLGQKRMAGDLFLASAGTAWNLLRPFPGYTGQPHLARATDGAAFAAELLARYVTATEAVFAGAPPPEPVMGWLEWLSLRGRILHQDVPLAEMGPRGA